MLRTRGDTQPFTWELTINGAAVDLTGATSLQFAYTKVGSSETTILDGEAVAPLTEGKVKFTPDSETFDTTGTSKFDVQAVLADGFKRTFVKSTIEIEDDVNKG